MAQSFRTGETWHEYLKRVVPVGPDCGSCQYKEGEFCHRFPGEKIYDGHKCEMCRLTIKNNGDQ